MCLHVVCNADSTSICVLTHKFTVHSEISLESSEDIGVGTILGGVINHIKASMLHLLKDQRDLLVEGP